MNNVLNPDEDISPNSSGANRKFTVTTDIRTKANYTNQFELVQFFVHDSDKRSARVPYTWRAPRYSGWDTEYWGWHVPPNTANSTIRLVQSALSYLFHFSEQSSLATSLTLTNCKILEGFWYQVWVSPQPEMMMDWSSWEAGLSIWGRHIGCMKAVNLTNVFSLRSATSLTGTVSS